MPVTSAQKAYALIWFSAEKDERILRARDILRESLSVEERQEGVKWLMDEYPYKFHEEQP